MKSLDMAAFVKSGFDCEFSGGGYWAISNLIKINDDPKRPFICDMSASWQRCRPRLNKPQVLDDYSKVLVDGLIWEVNFHYYTEQAFWGPHWTLSQQKMSTGRLCVLDREDRYTINWVSCIGFENLPEWEFEAKRLDMPLIDV